jgi:hypothetical protein
MNILINCPDCIHSYDGADHVLRCRVHSNGLACSPAAAEGCKKFEREPGADGVESPAHRVWYCDKPGRGD